MPETKFNAGERVAVASTLAFAAPGGVYDIVAALPRESGPQRYRVRNPSENFDRIMDEARLEPVQEQAQA